HVIDRSETLRSRPTRTPRDHFAVDRGSFIQAKVHAAPQRVRLRREWRPWRPSSFLGPCFLPIACGWSGAKARKCGDGTVPRFLVGVERESSFQIANGFRFAAQRFEEMAPHAVGIGACGPASGQ